MQVVLERPCAEWPGPQLPHAPDVTSSHARGLAESPYGPVTLSRGIHRTSDAGCEAWSCAEIQGPRCGRRRLRSPGWCSQVSTQASGTGGLSDLLALVVAWLLFGAGALLARRIPVGLAAAVILAGGAAMEVAAFSGPPHLSDDVFR